MRAMLFLAVFVFAVLLGSGCDQRLTPDLVRELLDNPRGSVTNESMAKVTRDLFQADRATSVESLANFIKADHSNDSDSNLAPGGVLEATSDVFCVGGLVASIATFDGCSIGDECKADLLIDSCILRVGDEGNDEAARGKIRFVLENKVSDEANTMDLGLEFQGWESSRDDDVLDALDGVIALQTLQTPDDSHTEVVFASDLDVRVRNKERGFFDDGYVEQTKVRSGLRFIANQDDTSAKGSLEVLAFVDEDGGRDESVVIQLAAEGHEVDAESAIASASVNIVGENGTFACTWSAASEEGERDGVKVTSEGSCVDEDGETFDFSGEAIASH